MSSRAFICGCSGLTFTADEKSFIEECQPWGLILFRRNIGTPDEVCALTDSFREITGRTDAPVLVDQEGGRVQRLNTPHWQRYPAGAFFNAISTATPKHKLRLAKITAQLMAHDLLQVGINVDCLPVLDVPIPGSHNVIGDRAYANNPFDVADLGRAAAEGMMAGGVLPVMKHIPGHGRAFADSHMELPVVDTVLDDLRTNDFAPFKANADLPAAMTAHVVYTALDPNNPATISAKIISEIIRGEIGFDGLLMSDDLSMKALTGSFRSKAERLFAAGVDMALHCNGNLGEAAGVAAGTPMLEGAALRRAEAAMARIAGGAQDFDPVDARAELETALAIMG